MTRLIPTPALSGSGAEQMFLGIISANKNQHPIKSSNLRLFFEMKKVFGKNQIRIHKNEQKLSME